MSSSLSSTALTGFLSLYAATATGIAKSAALVSLPPNPPPTLLTLAITL